MDTYKIEIPTSDFASVSLLPNSSAKFFELTHAADAAQGFSVETSAQGF